MHVVVRTRVGMLPLARTSAHGSLSPEGSTTTTSRSVCRELWVMRKRDGTRKADYSSS